MHKKLIVSILISFGLAIVSSSSYPISDKAAPFPAGQPWPAPQESKTTGPKTTQSSHSKNAYRPSPPRNPSQGQKPQRFMQFERLSDGAVRFADRILTKDGRVFPIRQYRPLLNPNDPYSNQWWIAPNAMAQVWDMPEGSYQTKVAVIDTGFALNHQEFAGRWAINESESGPTTLQGSSKLNCTDQGLALNKSCNNIDDNFDGIVDNESGAANRQNPSRLNCSDQAIPLNKTCNRLDDDNNGYIDDYRGWDFSNFDGNVQAGETNPVGTGTTHGTMVAGILGATGNNNVGIAGVNWHSKILPIQALDDDSYGDTYTVGEAIYYAADQGVDVISISLGTNAEDPYLRQAIHYALERGSTVVAASGNDGCSCISYPANYPEVIAVGAISSSSTPASFSSYGNRLDLLAPGTDITTSSWSNNNPTNLYVGGVAGTSFSAPFISGLLGLARSYQPDAKWEEIIGAMFERADRRTFTNGSPHSDVFGYGVVQASTMLERLRTPMQPAIRYQFGGTPVLGSTLNYQCENTLPATMLYELMRPGQLLYTSSQLEQYKLASQGWASKELMYTCIGLPTDTASFLRVINLPSEIRNQHIKQ